MFGFFASTNQAVTNATITINKEQIEAFHALLAQQQKIRLYVGTGGGTGNQAASANILNRLVGPINADNLTFAYDGIIDVYYEGGDPTLQTLYGFLPEMLGHPNGNIHNATVNLIAAETNTPPDGNPLLLGITGASDHGDVNYAQMLNVTYFLQLQPYLFHSQFEKVWFLANDRDAIRLDSIPELNQPSFARRLLYVPQSTYDTPVWGDNPDVKKQILRYLTTDDILSDFRLVVSYAIQNGVPRPEESAAILAGSMLQLQDGGAYGSGAPVIILNTNNFGTPADSKGGLVGLLMSGQATTNEQVILTNPDNPNYQNTKQTVDARLQYFQKLKSAQRFAYCNYPQTLQEVADAVALARGNKDVLFIQLGRIPQPLFYYAQYRSNLISLFEGANSIMGASNIGKPFLALPNFNPIPNQGLYPTVTRGYFDPPPISKLANAASQLFVNMASWPTKASNNPCNQLASLFGEIVADTSGTGPIKRYFTDIKKEYATSSADKLNVGLAYLMNLYKIDNPAQLMAASLEMVALEASENPLLALYATLQEKVTIGEELDLVPGVIATGTINKVMLAILAPYNTTLWMIVEIFEKEGDGDDITKITLTGKASILTDMDDSNDITVVFDAPDNQLRSDTKFSSEGLWSFPGVPWIQMTTPFLEVSVSDGPIPVIASMGGKYTPLGANLSLLMPTAGNQCLITAAFPPKYPSIDKIFQMAAGINLVEILPPPFNTLVDLGVEKVEVFYDSKTQNVTSLGFGIKNNSSDPLPLVGKVSLGNIAIQIGVIEPKDERKTTVNASGDFTIGSGDNAGVITTNFLYPSMVFSGGLTSGEIKFGDLLTFFLPPEITLQLPGLPTLTQFSFNYNKINESMMASVLLNLEWAFKLPGDGKISLENAGFLIAGEKGSNTGNVTAETTLALPGMSEPPKLSVGAYYEGQGKWLFAAKQTEGVFSIDALLAYCLGQDWLSTGISIPKIDGLEFALSWKKDGSFGDWKFKAKTASDWKIELLDMVVSAKVELGYKTDDSTASRGGLRMSKAEMPLLVIDESVAPPPALTLDVATIGPYGEISAEIVWNNIDLLVAYNFAPESKSFEVTWGILTGKIEEKQVDGKKCQIATLKFTQSTTLGSMVEIMVSWATGSKFSLSAPWDLLDKINLSNFELVYNFTDETVQIKVNIGPIELGFATINSIGLSYEKSSENASEKSVMIDLDASFVFGGKIPKWDATKPETTPSPEGSGNKYLDLRMLAMGQHVTFDGFKDATSVQKAIELMAKMPEPKSDEIPAITFDADSSWLFAADFGVLKVGDTNNYTLTLQTIFNDPNLYALRIALDKDAPAAKIFKGLDFQIMYRKLTDSLGVYQSEITLPDAMRHLTVGAYSVTLPVFGIEIYTNGDFKIDIGFPWNEDFSRSFTVEAIVPPGIPLTGSGGLYFGKIPQVVANVPVTTKGHFNPILVLGFGAQVGLGKTIEYGILKAGFSLTVFGILEGLLAKWNPYLPSTGTGNSSDMQLQGEYYFNIQGTFGVIGKIYGSVDFAVIKADVNITIKIFAQITFASYQPIPISVVASVDATASISINLGLFSIHIHFSFSVRVKETFVIGALQNPNDAPWLDNNQGHNGRLSSPLSARLRDHAIALNMAEMTELKPDWSRLTAPAAPAPLEAYLAFAPTVAGDDAFVGTDTPDKSKQLPCYITSIFIKSVPAATENDNASALKAETGRGDSSFEILAKMVARWGIASIQDSNVSPTSVDDLVVSDDSLKALLKYLEGTTEHSTPLPYADIETFITNQLQMTLSLPENGVSASSDNAAFFPMALPLTLDVPAYKDSTGKECTALNYRFDEYNTVDADFISWLRDYFNQLAVQVQNEGDSENGLTEMLLEGNASLAQFIFSDYFLLIMKQMLQAMRDGLRSFKYTITPDDTGNGIVSWVNTTGNLNGAFQLHDLFEGNANHKLNNKVGANDQVLIIPGVTYSVVAADTFDSIAAKAKFNNSFTGKVLAAKNAQKADTLKSGQTITYPGKDNYKSDGSVTLQTIADKVFAVSLDDLLDKSNILTSENLLVAFAPLALPNFNYTVQDGDTLNNIASNHGIDVRGLSITENGNITDIFDTTDNEHLDLVHLPQFQVGELIKEAQRAKAIEHLSGMASRYYLHGLRLPTDKITPNKDGMWVKNSAGVLSLPPDAGLFALTGQQFSIPALVADRPLTITLSRPKTLEWLIFSGGESSLAYTLKSEDSNYQSIRALHTYASQHALDTGLKNLGAESMVDSDSSNYPLSSSIPCQVEVSIDFPIGGEIAGDGQPRLWYLPDAMQSLPPTEQDANDVLPDFELQVHSYNEATGTSDSHDIQNYGWATSVDFTIKRLPKVEGDSAYNDTYEIMGADGTAALLLERMAQIGSEDSISLLTLGYNVKSGSDSAFRIAMGAGITMGISQSNLSTTTRPPAMMFVEMVGLQPQPEQPTLLNTKLEFIQFLWKASITRNGGFYLYFSEQDQGGLSDIIFNDKGEASLSLFVLYSGNKGSLHSYMNAALIGDPVNISVGGIIAKAISSQLSYAASDSDSAEGIAKRHYSSILSLAQNNPEMVLSSGAICTLVNGTYQVPIGGSSPGGSLSSIASHFSMDAQAIKDVNPRVNWSTGLAIGTAIRLPQVSLKIGASPGGTTLQDIARYYGTSGAAILGANSLATGLIGSGQNLTLAKGPFMQSGAEIPGVQAIGASRQALPAIPAPTDPGYAKDYLLHLYTLLGYRVSQNQDFVGSKMGLPLGPKGESGSEGMDKIRFVKAMNEMGLMAYSKGIPYVNLISAGNGHAEPVTNTYQANGRLLQMDYSWNDLYGNRLVTQLDERTLVDNKSPRAAVLTGYTDRLVGLSQWPGTSSHWTVAADTGDAEKFLLEVTISFDPSPYNKPVSGTSDSWQTRAHTALVTYEKLLIQLTDPNGIAVSFKTGLLAVLTSLTGDQIGTLTSATSTLVGWLIAIKQFLKERAAGNSADIELARNLVLSTPVQKEELNSGQVFVIDFEFIIRRTHGIAEGDFAAMPSVRSIATPITPLTVTIKDGETGEDSGKQGLGTFTKSIEDTLSDPEKFTLTVGTGKDRSKADASSSKTAVWGVRLSEKPEQGIYFSVNEYDPQSKKGAPQIFAPRPVLNQLKSGIVNVYPYSKPKDFDPTSNSFTTTPTQMNFTDIDLDNWVRQFFTAIDNLLSPQYLSSMLLIDLAAIELPSGISSFTKSFNEQKQKLARVAEKLMSAVYKSQESSLIGSAQEALYQNLLEKLSNLYSTRAAVSFSADVVADPNTSKVYENPQLYGSVVFIDPSAYNRQVVLTSPKLELATNEKAPLTFLLEAPALSKSKQGDVGSSLALDLRFDGAAIEHQITGTPGVENYKASAWLGLVRAETTDKLQANLGSFEVPMFIRGFPATPRMVLQTGIPFKNNAGQMSLADLTAWDYSFTYSQDYHYPQDRVYGQIDYNLSVRQDAALFSSFPDAFDALAQFITVKPELEKLLKEKVPQVSARTVDLAKINDAAKVLGAFLKMITDVTDRTSEGAGFVFKQSLSRLTGDAQLTYKFHIEEKSYTFKPDESSDDITAWVVKIVSSSSVPPVGLLPQQHPFADVPGDDIIRNVIPDNNQQVGTDFAKGIYAFWYSRDSKPLTGSDVQIIKDRKVTMPGLNILQREDARSTVYLKRNEELVSGNPSADEFVYQTPTISFTNSLLPTIDHSHPFDISTIPSSIEPETLAAYLSNFFEALFGDDTQSIQLECQYSYMLSEAIGQITLPVLMLPPISVNPKSDFNVLFAGDPGSGQAETFVYKLSNRILKWFNLNNPTIKNGVFNFDLTVMSHLTEHSMPLIRLRSLYLDVDKISELNEQAID